MEALLESRDKSSNPVLDQDLEKQLRKTERRLEALLDKLPHVILYETGEGREYISHNIRELLGYEAEEFIQNEGSFAKLIHPKDALGLKDQMQAWFNNGQQGVYTSQFRVRHRNGHYIWLEDQIINVLYEDGTKSMIGVMVDITNRHAHQQRYQAIVEAANVAGIGLGIFIDRGGVPVSLYVNEAATRIGGRPLSELEDQPIYEFLPVSSHEAIKNLWAGFLAGNVTRETLEIGILHKDGNIIPVSLGLSATQLDDQPAVIAFITDISERRRTEAALIAAKTEAEEISRIKSNILANFSHELRTPMHAILGFSSLLVEEIQDDDLKNYARTIQRSGQRLLSTLTSIIEVAALESNPGEIVLYPMLISELLPNIAERARTSADERRLQVMLDLQEQDILVLLDRDRFNKAFDKILHNAVKFTNQGTVTISLSSERRPSKLGKSEEVAVVSIRDTGVGMSTEFLKTAFEKFKQESDGFSRNYEGTGLGLTLARGYLHLMNGEIQIDSEINVGTTVTIRFPLVGRANFEAPATLLL